MRFGLGILVALGLGAGAVPALAERTDVLYSYKSWQVEGVTFDDDTYACLAEVSDPGESFSIWIFPDQAIRLVFFSEDWEFGESDSADLKVEIDRRGAWLVPDATLSGSTVMYELPEGKESVNFVLEVAKGAMLHLRSKDGSGVKDYSLAGSAASISKLLDCGEAISGKSNPFN